ncbi:MAG: 50S ribosomal protein L21 [Flavobacteriales bacterium]|jgi:large subunit ribosomal protein L21|uniref:50S ribosomal protein L21 n=1 Tax=Blattabacterium sp. (Mastotermes darwiniensis) TaxID=39768 RepID=UPI000231DF25|nr:50S ribosomal protein L21 [Blattabacterium sp. (Mastotermes darwiniensis)]AER40857.1 50S ribosomal protein L21 [Blattabacterium sp. (Mastotermes darwiniensis) str. MADAR]MDR1804704.1 50S ribosomal protein L21 [Flavobacteriales bacterium]
MTYAIVNILGHQFKLIENKYIYVPHIYSMDKGENIWFNQVFFFYKNGLTKIGTPFLEDINVKAEIIHHLKGDKIIIFKKKRRKGYKVKNGFRPLLTKIKIIAFLENKKK